MGNTLQEFTVKDTRQTLKQTTHYSLGRIMIFAHSNSILGCYLFHQLFCPILQIVQFDGFLISFVHVVQHDLLHLLCLLLGLLQAALPVLL